MWSRSISPSIFRLGGVPLLSGLVNVVAVSHPAFSATAFLPDANIKPTNVHLTVILPQKSLF